jgi:hypothetical protein
VSSSRYSLCLFLHVVCHRPDSFCAHRRLQSLSFALALAASSGFNPAFCARGCCGPVYQLWFPFVPPEYYLMARSSRRRPSAAALRSSLCSGYFFNLLAFCFGLNFVPPADQAFSTRSGFSALRGSSSVQCIPSVAV